MILYRPTGAAELALVERSGWRAWPPRLPEQPIFYPVLSFDYAEKIARDWNSTQTAPDNLGYVTRFEIEDEIGAGGMGVVYECEQPSPKRRVAIKLVDVLRYSVALERRFTAEAELQGRLQHPGIAPVYELGRFEDQRPFFTMKLVKGKTLAELLDARDDVDTDRAKFIGIYEQICQAMAYAHSRGVIHRDLKPANIMVGAFGGEYWPAPTCPPQITSG